MENMTTELGNKVLNTLIETETNFEVQKINLVTECGKQTGSYGMFRSDNGNWLGTMKDRYIPYQNFELVTLLHQATESLNLEVTNGGSLKGGSKVYYQIELPAQYIGKSDIKRQISALNSHDGSSSICLGSSNTVVICQNTFFKAHKEIDKVRHTSSAKDRVQRLAMDLKATIEKDLLLMDNFKRMADVQLKDEMIERLVNKLFKININKAEDISTRTKNSVQTFANNLETEIKLEGKTLWGLFNAVTRYTNHESAPKEVVKKTEYLMTGTGYQLSNLAYNDIMQWVEKNSFEYELIGK
jgi:phage/plasmid-like protein (TIGR03299 family)